MYKHFFLLTTTAILFFAATAQKKSIDQRVDSVLKLMTLNEKVGQLNQYNGDWDAATGPITKDDEKQQQIRNGQVGSLLNIRGLEHTTQLQKEAMQSRIKIPLLFGQDVIHGYFVTFPIPLAEAASWDIPAIELAARVAGTEAAAGGIHWTFAPMVDIARDPRWGRIMEGAGEDSYLGSLIAAARVRGFQGKGIGNTDAVMACAKHFAAYGAAVAGRDYNSVSMGLPELWNVYLPPFKAAADAGAATFMNSFNDLNGVPATGNSYLQRDILKGKWNFKGFVVSDWGSVGEMINHGYAKDNYDAALKAITAGSDMDMESRSYKDHLAKLVKDKKVPMALVDDAVKRILKKKFEMGLFEDPYRFSNAAREKAAMNNPAHMQAARDMAKKSIVLLKNENKILPLSKNTKTVAMIGPVVKLVRENLGFWSTEWPDSSSIVSQWEGIKNRLGPDSKLLYAQGCGFADSSRAGFAEAIAAAEQADVVIMSMGEHRAMSGEAKSRSNIHLPGVQEELIKAIHATGKPVIVLINAGRPLVFNWTADHVPAIVYTWWLGHQAGNAIADVLFGDYNPSGKLPATFPRTEGQIPIYYNYYNTGRPAQNENDVNYVSAYIDLQNSPRYAFGYGLSYTSFEYSNLKLSKTTISKKESIRVSFTLKNSGSVAGEEVAQLYIRDKTGSIVRPIKELKDFSKLMLQPGQSKEISFTINAEKLSFYNADLKWDCEPGEFELMIGAASNDIKLKSGFVLK
ncbi:MAG: glycoside hydrolase family 3 N-terminal domain-containing protein [Ferruginibacter sp.]